MCRGRCGLADLQRSRWFLLAPIASWQWHSPVACVLRASDGEGGRPTRTANPGCLAYRVRGHPGALHPLLQHPSICCWQQPEVGPGDAASMAGAPSPPDAAPAYITAGS